MSTNTRYITLMDTSSHCMKKIITPILALIGVNAQAAQEAPANQSAIDGMRSMALIKAEELSSRS